MAGEAKTNAFMIGEATVMIGPQASLMDLNIATHGVGLAKNVTISAEPSYTDLTQGVKNELVYSVMTGNTVKVNAEIYEYTAKNLAYGLGLDGSGLVAQSAAYLLKTAITGNDGTPVITAVFDAASIVTGNFLAGDWVVIQNAGSDDVHVAKLSVNSAQTGVGPYTHTLTFTGYGFKTGRNFAAGSQIYKVNRLDVGLKIDQPFFSAKIVGILPEESRPVTLLIPKIRITKGFNVAFGSSNFGNLPFEFTPYALVNTDPLWADFGNRGMMSMMHPR